MPGSFSLCRAQVTRYKPEMIRSPPIILQTNNADYTSEFGSKEMRNMLETSKFTDVRI
jgi:hypothetical protein